MKRVLVIGGGKIGSVVAQLLAQPDEGNAYQVVLADRYLSALQSGAGAPVQLLQLDIEDGTALRAALDGCFAVLSAAPYHLTALVAEAARDRGVHYLDLTEDVASTRRVRELAAGAPCAFIPQCGLAPGFISIAAADLARRFDQLHTVRLRVGALPVFPSNALGYNLTWSTEGLINEYCEPCEAIVAGHRREVQPLEGLEEFSLDGVRYEAFNTSGGLGTLCETLDGCVQELNYRTIRYPGHAALMRALLLDLRLKERRALFKEILEHALPGTLQDVVVIFVTVTGLRAGPLQQETFVRKVYGRDLAGQHRSAIQVTTASSLCAMLDLLASGMLPQTGFVRQEQVSLAAFLANRFGHVYDGSVRQHDGSPVAERAC